MQYSPDLTFIKQFEILLVDIHGVLTNSNSGLIANVDNTLENLMRQGKTIFILSNTTQTTDKTINNLAKLGLKQKIHFHELITSGEVARKTISEGRITFENITNPINFTCFGTLRKELFSNSNKYNFVIEPSQADFFYISIPQLNSEQAARYGKNFTQQLFVSSLFTETLYDSLIIDPFLPILEKFYQYKLPAFCANPDLVAFEKPKIGTILGLEAGKETAQYVIRQGAIAEAYQKMGGEVVMIGKPGIEIYEYALGLLNNKYNFSNHQLSNSKIAMIGDTLETDIMGAQKASKHYNIFIAGILTLTGVAAEQIRKQKIDKNKLISNFENYFSITPDYVINSFAS